LKTVASICGLLPLPAVLAVSASAFFRFPLLQSKPFFRPAGRLRFIVVSCG